MVPIPDTTVLIVEDETIIARDLQQRLSGLGYRVVGPLRTGEEAVALAGRGRPDIVVMDIVLGGDMDGVDAADAIRRSLEIPVVYLTAYADEETVSRAKASEPYGYIVKPFEEKELQITIEMALHRHRSEKALRESEERFRRLAEASSEGILVHDRGIALDLNDRLAEMLGFAPSELADIDLLDILPLKGREAFREALLARDEEPREVEIFRRDGSSFPAEVVSRAMPFLGQKVRVTSIRVLTERKQVERLLKERARSELYGFVVSALPLIAPGAYQEVRTDLLRIFADRFESYFRPGFDAGLGERRAPGKPFDALGAYLAWASALFSNFGIEVATSSNEARGSLELRNCPWNDYAHKNQVFCLLCRTMASRSFSWAFPGGAVGLGQSIAGGGRSCRLDFRSEPGGGGKKR